MKSKNAIRAIVIAVCLCLGLICIGLFVVPPTLTFAIELDGKPLPSDRIPAVRIDEQPFVSGSRLGFGRHRLSVALKDAESFEGNTRMWLWNKSLGALKLVSITGALNVSTQPQGCKVTLRKGGALVAESLAPAHFTNLFMGGYDLEVEKAGYKEVGHIVIDEKRPKDVQMKLKLGQVVLLSVPGDSKFKFSGGGRDWDGRLPSVIEDVPVGTYEVTVSRKGWELRSELEVQLNKTSTNQTIFSYGTISILSDPAGMNILSNGVNIGKAPLVLDEVRPEKYTFSASDGDYELSTTFTIEANQKTNCLFSFHYGTVKVASTPPGATVIRNGKEVGKTPLNLDKVPGGDLAFDIRLVGYISTNVVLHVVAGSTTGFAAKMTSERYLQCLKRAREAFQTGQFAEAQQELAVVLQIEPNDSNGMQLKAEITEAEQKAAKASVDAEQSAEKARLAAEETARRSRKAAERAGIIERFAAAPNAKRFGTTSREFDAPYDRVWSAAVQILGDQHEKPLESDKDKGVLITDLTSHRVMLLGFSDKYYIWIEELDGNTSRLTLMLQRYELSVTGENLVSMREDVDRKAEAFLDKIYKRLQTAK
jgi:hypothetical protein